MMFAARLKGVSGRGGVGVASCAAFVVLVAATCEARRTAAQSASPAQAARPTPPPATTAARVPPAPALAAPRGSGLPFGPPKLPRELFGKLFTSTKLEVSPDSILPTLTEVRASGMRVFIILVGSQQHYGNADGTFNLAMWKARVDRFRHVDFSEFIADGTIIAHQLISEAKARKQFGGKLIPNDVLDEMARHSKHLWPAMATLLRTDPSELEQNAAGYQTPLPGWKWTHLDAASARYLARKGPVAKFATDEQASADRQNLALVVGLNVFSGGDGSSGIRSPAQGKWAMSPAELRLYGSTLLSQTKPCGFEMWRYETPRSEFEDFQYFRRPDVGAAMVELAALAARRPALPCARQQPPR